MKTITLCLMLISTLTVGHTMAQEKVAPTEQISIGAKEVQTELQVLYAALKENALTKAVKDDSPQRKFITSLEEYNSKLHALYLEAELNTYFSKEKFRDLNQALDKTKSLASLEAVSHDRLLKRSLIAWLKSAADYSVAIEEYAILVIEKKIRLKTDKEASKSNRIISRESSLSTGRASGKITGNSKKLAKSGIGSTNSIRNSSTANNSSDRKISGANTSSNSGSISSSKRTSSKKKTTTATLQSK